MSPREKLLDICEEVRRVDDALGQRSDYEGSDEGPTYLVFTTSSKRHFSKICDEQIKNHAAGISVWLELQHLHKRWKSAPPPASQSNPREHKPSGEQ